MILWLRFYHRGIRCQETSYLFRFMLVKIYYFRYSTSNLIKIIFFVNHPIIDIDVHLSRHQIVVFISDLFLIIFWPFLGFLSTKYCISLNYYQRIKINFTRFDLLPLFGCLSPFQSFFLLNFAIFELYLPWCHDWMERVICRIFTLVILRKSIEVILWSIGINIE